MKSRKAIVIGFAFALAILTFLSVGYASAVTTHYVNPGDSLLAIKGVSGSSLVDYHPASFSKEFQQHPPKTQDRASSSVNTWIVISVADSGQGTLRQAMLEASSGDTIAFDPAVFSPASPATIKLTSSELPELIQGNITIDASNAGVILDGVNNSHGSGLRIHSDHNVVKGLQILHFPEYGVHLTDGINNTITDNCAYNNSNGIYLSSSSNNTITVMMLTTTTGMAFALSKLQTIITSQVIMLTATGMAFSSPRPAVTIRSLVIMFTTIGLASTSASIPATIIL